MKYRNILNIIILVILFLANIIIKNYNYFFLLIYSFLLFHNIYIIYLVTKYGLLNKKRNLFLVFISLFSYLFSYFMICDTNPIISIITYYIFFPNFFKAIIIIIFHTFFLSKFYIIQNYKYINNLDKNNFSKKLNKNYLHNSNRNYFLSYVVNYFKASKNRFGIFLSLLILFLLINIILFVNRIKLWIYFNGKE